MGRAYSWVGPPLQHVGRTHTEEGGTGSSGRSFRAITTIVVWIYVHRIKIYVLGHLPAVCTYTMARYTLTSTESYKKRLLSLCDFEGICGIHSHCFTFPKCSMNPLHTENSGIKEVYVYHATPTSLTTNTKTKNTPVLSPLILKHQIRVRSFLKYRDPYFKSDVSWCFLSFV